MSRIPILLSHIISQELGIHVVPLPFVWDGFTYLDDVDMGPREFYTRLRTSKTVPTTSGPTPGSFREVFGKLSQDGKPTLAILVGSVFSSTFLTATVAKGMGRGVDVTLVDSDLNTMGLGFVVLAAARAANQGKGMNEVLEVVRRVKEASGVVFAVQDIAYLRRGGRIASIEGFFASMLRLIPIMELRGGPIRPVERIRTDRQLLPRLLDLVAERLEKARPLRLAVLHADAETKAWDLMRSAQKRFAPDELILSELTPVLGTHTGPDALGIAYSFGA